MGTIRRGRRATALVAATLLAAGLALSGCSVSGPSAGSVPEAMTDVHGRTADGATRPDAVVASGTRPVADHARARPHHAIDLAFARAAWSAQGDQQQLVGVRVRPRPIR